MSNPEWVRKAKVGDKVVCVCDGSDLPCVPFGDAVPVAGEIYTIREIEVGLEDGEVYLMFQEIRNDPRWCLDGFGEVCFHNEDSRPVEPRKTDISVFTQLLHTAPAMEEA